MSKEKLDLSTYGSNENGRLPSLNNFLKLHDPIVDVEDDNYKKIQDNINSVAYNKKFMNRHGFDDGIDKLAYDENNPDVAEWINIAKRSALDALRELWANPSSLSSTFKTNFKDEPY